MQAGQSQKILALHFIVCEHGLMVDRQNRYPIIVRYQPTVVLAILQAVSNKLAARFYEIIYIWADCSQRRPAMPGSGRPKSLASRFQAGLPSALLRGCTRGDCFPFAALFHTILPKGIGTTEDGSAAQITFDAQQLIVFSCAFRSAWCTGLDLSAIGGHGKIRNGGISVSPER